jgi:ATP-dependent RNA helicase DeaD
VTVAAKTSTAENITQRYWLVAGMQKLDALTRILEAEPFDGMIIFARTKLGTEELAGKLQARGFAAAAINGDMAQQQRERTIEQLKSGRIDILVATDVAARGLDVERLSHVINYDVPSDPESYTHRIGRTGRAGRSGDAILFITPRERGMLSAIERATRQPVSQLTLPTVKAVNDVRIAKFKDQIAETLAAGGLEVFRSLIEEFEREQNVPAVDIAAALAKLSRGDIPLLLEKPDREARPAPAWEERAPRAPRPDAPPFKRERERERAPRTPDAGMGTYRIEVGHVHGVKPGNIVGAIANEAGIDSKFIGRIEINDDHSTLDLPADLPPDLMEHLKKVWVAGQQLNITRDGEAPAVKKAGTGPKKGAERRLVDKAPGKKPHRKGPQQG